jgi:hypothetical protein
VARRRADNLLDGNTVYYGTSLGAVYAAASALLLDDFDAYAAMAAELILYCADVADGWYDHFGTCTSRFRSAMHRHFPEDISRAQGRCNVCITHFNYFGVPQKKLVSKFESKTDLINAISASMFIPVWAVGLKRPWNHFRGKLAIDGGIVDNSPKPRLEKRKRSRHSSGWTTHETVCDTKAPFTQVLFPPRAKTRSKITPKIQVTTQDTLSRDTVHDLSSLLHESQICHSDTPGLVGALNEVLRGFTTASGSSKAASSRL